MKNTGRRLATTALIAGGLTLLSWVGLTIGTFQGAQLRLTDGLFPAVAPDPRIVVVGIDEESLARLGRWPWDRGVHARLIDALDQQEAALIGYDVTFSEPSDPENDGELGRAVREAGSVVLGAGAEFTGRPGERILQAERVGPPIPELAEAAASVGHVNVVPDPDGVVRSLPVLIETPDGDLLPALSTALFQQWEGADGPPTLRADGVQLDGAFVRTGRARLLDVNFAEGYPTYSAADVVDGDVPADAFRDRIVLVGATAVGLRDYRLTPLDKATGEAGVLVHANGLNTMLTRAYLVPESLAVTLLFVFVLSLLVAAAVAFLWAWLSPLVSLGLGAGFVWLVFTRFDSGRVMNLVYPLLALFLAYIAALVVRYLTEVRERRRVTRTFTRYLSGDVVEEVLASPDDALATLKGVSRPLSVLFSDLRGFTSASEGVTPSDVVAALNVYLDAMTRAVLEEQGTIDKFMGDCVMAFWNAPREEPSHADHAVRAAIRMLDEIDRAIAERPETALLRVKGCGVGVATGEAVVGNIGSTERLDYTVVGDTVNTASRLCGVAGPGQVVVTEETAQALGDEFRLAPLPPLSVKGKALPLRVFQVLREGQEAQEFAEGSTLDATEEKGHFDPAQAPGKAAGYSPVEPRPEQSSS